MERHREEKKQEGTMQKNKWGRRIPPLRHSSQSNASLGEQMWSGYLSHTANNTSLTLCYDCRRIVCFEGPKLGWNRGLPLNTGISSSQAFTRAGNSFFFFFSTSVQVLNKHLEPQKLPDVLPLLLQLIPLWICSQLKIDRTSKMNKLKLYWAI